ncbi:acyl carrier protein 1, chloroplastic-like [Henckelia pumila]|uniref:acyl carrier protein 1, chloroplastic-like n=1 Tax=Henckelia pumila TaxID=405737 RepID=UPI003C6E4124
MASVSAACSRFGAPMQLSLKTSSRQISIQNPRMVSMVWATSGAKFARNSRASRFQMCAAKPETVDRVCSIVKEQLALTPDAAITPDSKFSDLGADSLDTVEIVMKLEEEFDIIVPEDNSGNIATIQEAADLIHKLVEQKVAT